MSANQSRGQLGYLQLKKEAGSGALAANTVVNIPSATINPNTPINNNYPALCNASNYLSQYNRGKIVPSFVVRAQAKSSWLTANFIKSLLITRDSNNDTDRYWAQVYNGAPGGSPVKYDDVKCVTMTLAAANAGGPVACEMGFIAKTDQGSGTFSSFSTDAGMQINAAACDFGSSPTADLVLGWALTITCAQAPDLFMDDSLYPSGISSAMAGFLLTLEQSPMAATIPSSAMTVRLNTGAPGSGSVHMTLAALLNLDAKDEQIVPGFGRIVRSYTGIDTSTGGLPLTIT